jgi:hypothetical protein
MASLITLSHVVERHRPIYRRGRSLLHPPSLVARRKRVCNVGRSNKGQAHISPPRGSPSRNGWARFRKTVASKQTQLRCHKPHMDHPLSHPIHPPPLPLHPQLVFLVFRRWTSSAVFGSQTQELSQTQPSYSTENLPLHSVRCMGKGMRWARSTARWR